MRIPVSAISLSPRAHCRRYLTIDQRQRLSKQFLPITKERTHAYAENASQSHAYLLQGGFLRQSSSGVYTLLPLGLRTLEKLQNIIQQEMDAIGGQRLMMPLLLQSDHWKTTGRWGSAKGEFFRFKDRKEVDYLLAPTHEEEVTSLVAQELRSAKQLPIRLYQIGRKYRDELRPRAGLLRGREFIMKDLYSFDKSMEDAFSTYDQVAGAYAKIFDRVGIPYLVAEADSGNIGGSKSHEYHLLSPIGEDTLLTCHGCGYTANEELAEARFDGDASKVDETRLLYTIDSEGSPSKKGTAMVVTPRGRAPNLLKVTTDLQRHLRATGELADDLDKKKKDGSGATLDVRVVGSSESGKGVTSSGAAALMFVDDAVVARSVSDLAAAAPIDTKHYRVAAAGDACHHCAAPLASVKAIEVAHTFYLGTTYSEPLQCSFVDEKQKVPVQMGCYGIGISRLLAAVAEARTDTRGLVWPASIAPYKICIIATDDKQDAFKELANNVYDQVNNTQAWANDVVLDDRRIGFGRKMTDAELIGYPWILVLGRKALQDRVVEIHQRQLNDTNKKIMLPLDDLPAWLSSI
ncbi:hypothetical protein BC940DRAFT_264558 [Gongronella butleri]|nr:hypothetical protein BC940DRAFT_264558 [Gongronella butleri]